MKSYYQGRRARNYDRQWRTFTERTLTVVLPLLEKVVFPSQLDHRLRILDVGCGTGTLLKQIAKSFPDAELYGVDSSRNMLDQARQALSNLDHVHLVERAVGSREQANLPFEPESFDLITCTNTLHYFTDPVATLQGLRRLLVPMGKLVIEDYTLRRFPLPWSAFEWAIKFYDPQHVRLYRACEAQVLFRQAGLRVLHAQTFEIDLFCQGWVVLLEPIEPL